MKIFDRKYVWFLVLLVILAVEMGTGTLLMAETVRETVDGVVHVRNSAVPADGIETLRLEELWRVGGDDDEEILFGLIPKAASDEAGNIYILDSQLNHVVVFSPEGDLERTLFREGEGPGEIRQARDMMVFGDGRVGIVQEVPGVAIFVDADGNPAGRVQIGGTEGGSISLAACGAAGDHFVISGSSQSPGNGSGQSDRNYFLSTFDVEGIETARYAESFGVYDYSNFVFREREHTPTFWWCFAAAADGRTCVAPDRDKYAIHVFDAEGNPEMVIEKEFDPIDRGDVEYKETRQIFESALTNLPMNYRLETERSASAIAYLQRGLRFRSDGSIWSLGARGIRDLPQGTLAVFDVFDRSGEYRRQVALKGAGDPLRDGLFFVGNDRLVVIKGYMESMAAQFGSGTTGLDDDEDEGSKLAVVCYRLVR